jgi:3-phenylpropionate/cinnamic acid dioxygenase small subunit
VPNKSAIRLPVREVSRDLQQEIEQFLFYEAALLDNHELDAWFELLADDLRYVMPVRSTRSVRDQAHEFSGPRDVAYFDESKASIGLRIRRLHTGSAWAEEPRSRTRHFVCNVRIACLERAGDYEVTSAFLLYRNRAESQTDVFAGERIDTLRRVDTPAGFQLAGRRVLIDQSMLLANNISFFF